MFLDNGQLTGNVGAFLERGPGLAEPCSRPLWRGVRCGAVSAVSVAHW